MRLRFRSLLALTAVLLVSAAGASAASACGNGGYTYAGVASSSPAFGIGAVITPLTAFSVGSGHVAGWVGVGGPGQGAGGRDEWLQVGFSAFPGLDGSNIYYELMLPNRAPTYHEVATGLTVGRPAHVAVLEMSKRANYWRVWVNGSPVSKPIHLPSSHGRWAPIATAESWDGGSGARCNGFLYRFRNVSVAQAPGGSWHTLVGGQTISSSTTRIARSIAEGSFIAAQGDEALRTLSLVSP
jgi:hypothetical protein